MFVLCCGRFQPFHNGHLRFLRQAARQPGQIVIGVIVVTTVAESGRRRRVPKTLGAMGDARLTQALNPYSALERVRMISACVKKQAWASRAMVVPIPRPDVYWEIISAMFPGERTWALPVSEDPFEDAKERWYRQQGDRVVRINADLSVSGTRVRKLLATDRSTALTLVPAPVASFLGRKEPRREARGRTG